MPSFESIATAEVRPAPGRRPSAVSQVLRSLERQGVSEPAAWALTRPGGHPSGFRLSVCRTAQARAKADELVRSMYTQCGYFREAGAQPPACASRAGHESTFLIEDAEGVAAATATLVFDQDGRLPCDEIFAVETGQLRAGGRRLVEVARLALQRRHAGEKALLLGLFTFIYIYARKIRGYDDFLIEVNPRHLGYYKRFLLFTTAGEERPCPRVNGAPALLARLDLSVVDREVRRQAADLPAPGARTLFPYYCPPEVERAILGFLRQQLREEGLARPGTARHAPIRESRP